MSLALGDMIEKLRDTTGLSQRALAGKLNVDPSYLSRLESGARDPSIAFLRRLAEVTSTPLSVLLAGALMEEVPEEKRAAYERIFGKLVELAQTQQGELDLNEA